MVTAVEYWGHLFSDEDQPSQTFLRFANVAFDYVLEHYEPKDLRPDELTPDKLAWMYDDLGHEDETIPIPLDRLLTYYRKFHIKFVMRQVDDTTTKVPALRRQGWYRLLAVCFLKAPEEAWEDMEQMILQWGLIDPSSNEPFPPVPRTSAPSGPLPAYAAKHAELVQEELSRSRSISPMPNPAPDSPISPTPGHHRTTSSISGGFLSPPLVSPGGGGGDVREPVSQLPLPPPYVLPGSRPRSTDPIVSYGATYITAEGSPTPGIIRLLTAIFQHVVKHAEPADEPHDVLTPYKMFWADVEAGHDVARATFNFTILQPVYDEFELAYEMRQCTLPQKAVEVHPELAPLLSVGPRVLPCLTDPAEFVKLQIYSVLDDPNNAIQEYNTYIEKWHLVDPGTGAPFPLLERTAFPETASEVTSIRLQGVFAEASRRQWKGKLVIETSDNIASSEAFRRYADSTFDWVLKHAPPTQPADCITSVHLRWWYTKLKDPWAELLEDDTVHAYFMLTWRKLGIGYIMRNVQCDGQTLGNQACLDKDGWRAFLTMEILYDPQPFHARMGLALGKWPLFDQFTGQRILPPMPQDLPEESVYVTQKKDMAKDEFFAAMKAAQESQRKIQKQHTRFRDRDDALGRVASSLSRLSLFGGRRNEEER